MQHITLCMKRLADITAALIVLIVLSPFILLISLAVALETPGGFLFTQPRVGKNGRPFRVYKFRSMRPHRIDYAHLAEVHSGDPLVTRVGGFLRKYGIDELPQVWNILIGDMSFVGPRPTIREQVEQYSPFQRRRLEVRPGLTGLAQVSGNTSLAWKDRILLDVWYIDHWSLWLDLRILLATIEVVLRGQVMGQPVRNVSFLPTLNEAAGYASRLEQSLAGQD